MARPSNFSSAAYSMRAASSASQLAAHPGVEGLGAAGGGVGLGADGQHGHRVAHRREAVQHPAQHALGGRIGVRSAGCAPPAPAGLEQPVVLGVRQLGRVQHVVAVGVMVQRGAQLRGLGGRLGRHRRHSSAWQGPVEVS
jgi:hypothetical protein